MYLFLEAFFYFVTIFLVYSGFCILDPKFCTWKLKVFVWKISILCAWKIKANALIFVKKSTRKTTSVSEISSKSLHEKRITHIKQNEKKAKTSFHAHYFFPRMKKKTLNMNRIRLEFACFQIKISRIQIR